jgi:signal transduction histidine kinase
MLAAIRIIGAPMQELASHARRIGTGDLGHRLRFDKRRDEIGTLADEMNAMSEQLAIAQERKRTAEEQVRHADRMTTVGTLAAGMAHELGTPLGIIAGRAKMIATEHEASPSAVQCAQIIGGQVERMTRIMRGLLDFARHAPAKKAATNLVELTKRIIDLLGPLAAKRDVALQLECETESASADVDAGKVEQAVANLVVNGIQAMDKAGHVDAGVHRVRCVAPGKADPRDYVCISIRDAGSGIREEDLPHIFEPFFTTKDVGEGTGLGLAVTYGIVHEHGGFVDVRSTVSSGTCVSLYFPA